MKKSSFRIIDGETGALIETREMFSHRGDGSEIPMKDLKDNLINFGGFGRNIRLEQA